jgi:hypothetical protein
MNSGGESSGMPRLTPEDTGPARPRPLAEVAAAASRTLWEREPVQQDAMVRRRVRMLVTFLAVCAVVFVATAVAAAVMVHAGAR